MQTEIRNPEDHLVCAVDNDTGTVAVARGDYLTFIQFGDDNCFYVRHRKRKAKKKAS